MAASSSGSSDEQEAEDESDAESSSSLKKLPSSPHYSDLAPSIPSDDEEIIGDMNLAPVLVHSGQSNPLAAGQIGAQNQAPQEPPPAVGAQNQAPQAPPPAVGAQNQAPQAPPPAVGAQHQAPQSPPPTIGVQNQAPRVPLQSVPTIGTQPIDANQDVGQSSNAHNNIGSGQEYAARMDHMDARLDQLFNMIAGLVINQATPSPRPQQVTVDVANMALYAICSEFDFGDS
jgi:hypothetical protein